MKINLFDFTQIYPFKFLGLTSAFWTVHSDIILWTWGAMIGLAIFTFIGNRYAHKEYSRIRIAYAEILSFFFNLCEESFTPFNLKYFIFTTSLFLFTAFCSLIGLIPFFDEATRDLNTTLALGLTSFLYVHYQKIKLHGILGYINEYLQPFFLLLPINLIGELAKIASLSFRLFGNILGGSIILFMAVEVLADYKFIFFPTAAVVILFDIAQKNYPGLKEKRILGWVMGIIGGCVFFVTGLQFFFGVFEGLIQAFVLTMLTITYLSMNIEEESSHEQGVQE